MRGFLNLFSTVGKVGVIGSLIGFLAGMVAVFIVSPVAGVVFTLLGLGVYYLVYALVFKQVVKQKALTATGEEAEARILEVTDTAVTVNERYPQIKLLLEVHPKTGEPYQVKIKTLINRMEIPQFQAGVMVPVVINPKNRKEVAVGTRTRGTGDSGMAGAMTNAMTNGDAGAMSPEQIETLKAKLQEADKVSQEIIATGEEAPAKIALANWMGVYLNGNNPLMHFMLEVMPAGRPSFMAEATGVIAEASVPRYQPGETITVKFDPKDLTRVALFHS
jgi:uncharacterized membrane protein